MVQIGKVYAFSRLIFRQNLSRKGSGPCILFKGSLSLFKVVQNVFFGVSGSQIFCLLSHPFICLFYNIKVTLAIRISRQKALLFEGGKGCSSPAGLPKVASNWPSWSTLRVSYQGSPTWACVSVWRLWASSCHCISWWPFKWTVPVFWPFCILIAPPSLKIVLHPCWLIFVSSFFQSFLYRCSAHPDVMAFLCLLFKASLGSRFLLKSMPSGWTEHLARCWQFTMLNCTCGVSPWDMCPKEPYWDFPGVIQWLRLQFSSCKGSLWLDPWSES